MTFPLYLDEMIDPRVAVALRREGHDAVTTQEAGLAKASDDVQLAFATQHCRVLFTHDLATIPSLLREWQLAERPHPGIILSHWRNPEHLASALGILLAQYGADDLANVVPWLPPTP